MTRVENWLKLAPLAHYHAYELAGLCHVSTRTLQRQFQETLGRSPQEWLDIQRVHAAKDLLRHGFTVKETAADLGFKHPSHFCRQFKAQAKMTPSQFAAAHARTPPSHIPELFVDYSI